MKKKCILFIFVILISVFLLPVISADTTFFEGDYDYRNDFIMSSLPEEVIEAVAEGGEILQVGGGGYFVGQKYNTTKVCEVCIDSLREHIKEYQDIEYNENEVTVLTGLINQEFQTDLSNNQIRYIIENFEDECDAPYPLLGGIAGGRFRNLTTPLTLWITSIVLIFFIIIGYLIIRALKKRGYGRRRRKKR